MKDDNSKAISEVEDASFWREWKPTRPSNGKRRNGGAPLELNITRRSNEETNNRDDT